MKTLKLQSGAFNEELLRFTPDGKIGWPGDDHGHFADALLRRLHDGDNQKVMLEGLHHNIIKLILRPTEELQRRVLKQTLAAAGYELDATTEAAFASLFDAVGFGDYLSKKTNPKTGKPYIRKVTKGAKKNALDALMDREAAVVETVAPTKPDASENLAAAIQPVPAEVQQSVAAK